MLLTLALIACEPVESRFVFDFIGGSPLEVDTVANDTNGDGVIDGFVAEEITADLRYLGTQATDAGAIADVDFYSYSVTYELLNAEGELGGYANGVTIGMIPGDQGQYPIRAVSFDQKFSMADQFNGQPVNVRATVVMPYRVNDVDNGLFITGDFDIIFADFVEP
ncbi:MAG TPA: hypothetical protein PKY30_08655 [Myxococcota bacterium]|nr:hypothetical protein [Myxococcota bacterium]HNH47095.1 hypothetical protein [Myxococcota bacterium]